MNEKTLMQIMTMLQQTNVLAPLTPENLAHSLLCTMLPYIKVQAEGNLDMATETVAELIKGLRGVLIAVCSHADCSEEYFDYKMRELSELLNTDNNDWEDAYDWAHALMYGDGEESED